LKQSPQQTGKTDILEEQ